MKPRLYDLVRQSIDVNIVKMADSIENMFESKLKEKLTQAEANTAAYIGVKIKNINFMDCSFEIEDVEFYKAYSEVPKKANSQSTEIYNPLKRLVKNFDERHYMCYVTNSKANEEIFVGFSMFDPAEITIEDMNFSKRTYNFLKRSGFTTCEDMVNIITNCDDSLKIANLGKSVLDEVREKTRAIGFTSSGEDFEN